MVNEAIAKITKEMMEASHPFAQFIEEYLTEICVNEAVAGKLLNPEKNLKEFTKNVEAEARKKQKGGVYGAPDREFFRRAEEYYGITEEDKASRKARTGAIDILDLL